jgi:hypothetical protein
VTELGVAGFLARGFLFAMIGLFLLFAAVHSRLNEAKGSQERCRLSAYLRAKFLGLREMSEFSPQSGQSGH